MTILPKMFALLMVASMLVACGEDSDSNGGAGGAGAEGGAGGAGAEGGAGGAGAEGGAGGAGAEGGAGGAGGGAATGAEDLVERIVASTCGALTRCCNATELDSFWLAISSSPRFEDLRGELPPQVPATADNCVELLTTAYTYAPFGGWVEAIGAGLTPYNGAEADACLAALDSAECGRGVVGQLFESACFPFQPPIGEDRTPFPRTGAIGEPCMAIPDGASGGFFGTCNGTQAWCATVDGDRNRITTAGEMGTCVAASQVGDPCGLFPSANVCARGTQCSVDGVCEAEAVVGPVGVGEPCWDTENFRELGKCQDSYCDLLGDGTCLPFKENGETCEGINQCLSYGCTDGVCVERAYCGGDN